MSAITMEQMIRSNAIKKETCNKCKEDLQNILTQEQLQKFEEVFYSATKNHVFIRKER